MKGDTILWLTVLVLLTACKPKIKLVQATPEDIQYVAPSEPKPRVSPAVDPLAYVAYPELITPKYIRVNFHFMNSSDGRYNMPEEKVTEYAREWVKVAHHNLENNMKMFLPRGNDTPVIPIPYRYVISPDTDNPDDTGVYYHVDDELCYVVKTGRDRNISDKRVIAKYAHRADSVLNIFVQTHHLDSIPSKTYRPDGSGISLGSSVKIFGRWFEEPSAWNLRGITNHEIAHSLGLSHTWTGYDGCDDTPAHPNCWNVSEKPPCDSLYSNNMMDYNAHMVALTPCQIGKVLMNMHREGSMQRSWLVQTWCTLDTSATVTVTDSMRWNGHMDLEGHLVIKPGGVLEIAARISLPNNGKIIIHPGGKLVVMPSGRIHHACDGQWGGIELYQVSKIKGEIIIEEGGRIEHPSLVTPARS